MLTEDIDSSMRSLRAGFMIVSDPGLVSTELAPITIGALWHQRTLAGPRAGPRTPAVTSSRC